MAGLWEFPSLTVSENFSPEDALQEFGVIHGPIQTTERAVHIFTHVEWHMEGYAAECDEMTDAFVWVTPEELRHTYAMPSAYRVYRKLVLEQS